MDEIAGPRGGAAAAVEHLRALLTACGLIPARDNRLARLEAATRQRIASAHSEDQLTLTRYARWVVIARARRDAVTSPLSSGRQNGGRAKLATPIHYLAWLRDHASSLETSSQPLLEFYLSTNASHARQLIPFLRWARRNRLTPKLFLPPSRYEPPRHRHQESHRREILHDALTQTAWEPRERAFAVLTLCFGLSPAAIASLTRHQLCTDNGLSTLHIGRCPIVLPPRIAELLNVLPVSSRQGVAQVVDHSAEPWLFPGRRPGSHLDPSTVARCLRGRGIQPRLARNTTMSALANDLAVPVMARLLGVTYTTAQAWQDTLGVGPEYVGIRTGQGHPARR